MVVSAVNLVYALLLYGSNGLDCSILFASGDFIEGFIPFNITCGTLLKYQILLAFTGAISITGITLVFSAICKNQMVALVVSRGNLSFPDHAAYYRNKSTVSCHYAFVLIPCAICFPYVGRTNKRRCVLCTIGCTCCVDIYGNWHYYFPESFCETSGFIN